MVISLVVYFLSEGKVVQSEERGWQVLNYWTKLILMSVVGEGFLLLYAKVTI